MLTAPEAEKLLQPFAADLSEDQLRKVLIYVGVLLRWNQKINLTAVRTPAECLTRHFGESFLVSRAVPIDGSLLDVGSGAGFPGLALKILHPGLAVVLLEPTGKKRAFLREVANVCDLSSVRILGSTIQEFTRTEDFEPFDLVTMRAVGKLQQLLPHTVNCLKPHGRLCLWLGSEQIEALAAARLPVCWHAPVPIPLSRKRQIVIGTRQELT